MLLSLDLGQTEDLSLLVSDKQKRGTQGGRGGCGQLTTTLMFINKVNESKCSYVSIFSNLNGNNKRFITNIWFPYCSALCCQIYIISWLLVYTAHDIFNVVESINIKHKIFDPHISYLLPLKNINFTQFWIFMNQYYSA